MHVYIHIYIHPSISNIDIYILEASRSLSQALRFPQDPVGSHSDPPEILDFEPKKDGSGRKDIGFKGF